MLRALSLASGSQPAGGCRIVNDTPPVSHDSGAVTGRIGMPRDRIRSSRSIGRRIGRPAETGRDADDADREAIEQVEHAVVVILVGMAQEDGVDPAHSARPERRRDDPAADARVAQPPAVVEKGATVRGPDQYGQAMPDRKEFGLGGRGARRQARREQPARDDPGHEQPPRQMPGASDGA